MTKIKSFLAVFAAALMVSCGAGSGTSADSEVSKNSAGEIIDYYNLTLEVFRNGLKERDCDQTLEYMNNKGKTLVRPTLVAPLMFRDSAKLTTSATCFNAALRDSLKNAFREYFAASGRFKDNYEAFKAYVEAEDYKDDNWAKGTEMATEQQQAYDRIFALRSGIVEMISGLADQAEMVLMEDNPLKDHIMLGKKIFASMEVMMEAVAADPADVPVIDSSYNQLEQLVKDGRALPTVKDMANEMKWYGEYLDEVDSFLGVVRKASRNNKYTSSVLDDMQSEYKDAVSDYNTFVD